MDYTEVIDEIKCFQYHYPVEINAETEKKDRRVPLTGKLWATGECNTYT